MASKSPSRAVPSALRSPVLPRLQPRHAAAVDPDVRPALALRLLGLGGWLVAFCAVALALGGFQNGQAKTGLGHELCQTLVDPGAKLSRVQLAQLLTVPERALQSQIREQLAQPYCQLPDLEVRAGVMAQREVYPLAFDPQTWLVLLFEGEEYGGYAFQFQP